MVRKTVLIDDSLLKQLDFLSKKEDRDFSGSIRRALKIGLAAIRNPDLTAQEIEDALEAKAELDAGMVAELKLENL